MSQSRSLAALALLLLACSPQAQEQRVEPRREVTAAPTETGPYTHPILRSTAPHPDDPVMNPSVPPVRLAGDEPKYTDAARRHRVQGVVIIRVIIERDGRVSAGKVVKPLPDGLDQAAIDAVRTWKYKPGVHKGRPVRTLQNVTVLFKLPA
jgi:protein TonB